MNYGKYKENYILACNIRNTGHYNSIIIIFIFKLNILPTTYAVMVGMIFVLLGFINYALMKPNKKNIIIKQNQERLLVK